MAEPGWYEDAQGVMRWWDGEQWTEHVQPAAAPASNLPLEIETHPGNERTGRLLMTDEGVSIKPIGKPGNDRWFAWNEIERVQYAAVDHYRSAQYLNTTFTIGVGNANDKASFSLMANATSFFNPEMDVAKRSTFRDLWGQAVDVLDTRVCIPMIDAILATVHGGGTAEVAGVLVDRDGLHKSGRLGSKSLGWHEAAGTEVRNSEFLILAREGSKTKPRIRLTRDGWNVVLLPRVIAALSTTG